MSFRGFQDCCLWSHLGYPSEAIIATMNLYVVPSPAPMFQYNLTFSSEEDTIRRPQWWPFWILEMNDFSTSKHPCCPNASKQVLAQPSIWYGRKCSLKNWRIATRATILDIKAKQFDQFWMFKLPWFYLSSFSTILKTVSEEIVFEEFQDGHHCGRFLFGMKLF